MDWSKGLSASYKAYIVDPVVVDELCDVERYGTYRYHRRFHK